jgi:hypothetical protein
MQGNATVTQHVLQGRLDGGNVCIGPSRTSGAAAATQQADRSTSENSDRGTGSSSGEGVGDGFRFSQNFLLEQEKIQHKAAMDDFRQDMKTYLDDLKDKLTVLQGRESQKPMPRVTAAERRTQETQEFQEELARKQQSITQRLESLREERMVWRRAHQKTDA